MTLEELIALIPTDCGWSYQYGKIRDKDGRCPLAALSGTPAGDIGKTLVAIRDTLGIQPDDDLVAEVISAADRPLEWLGAAEMLAKHLGLPPPLSLAGQSE